MCRRLHELFFINLRRRDMELNMKKGINQWSFPSGYSLNDCIKLAKKAGFDGFEPAFDETGAICLESTDADIREVKAMADAQGLALSSLASGLYWKYPLTSDSESVRAKSADIVKRQLHAAAVLGVDTILVVPGLVGASFMPNAGTVDYVTAYDRALSALSVLADEAKKCGVSIGIENVWNRFLLSPVEMRDFIDKIGSEWVGAYFDVGNVMLYGYPEHYIRALGKRIKKVHFKDFRINCGNIDGFVDLLCGDVNFPEVVHALSETGYDSYCIGEMGAYKHYGDQVIYNTSMAMDRIFENK